MVHRLGELSARLDQIIPFLGTDGRKRRQKGRDDNRQFSRWWVLSGRPQELVGRQGMLEQLSTCATTLSIDVRWWATGPPGTDIGFDLAAEY